LSNTSVRGDVIDIDLFNAETEIRGKFTINKKTGEFRQTSAIGDAAKLRSQLEKFVQKYKKEVLPKVLKSSKEKLNSNVQIKGFPEGMKDEYEKFQTVLAENPDIQKVQLEFRKTADGYFKLKIIAFDKVHKRYEGTGTGFNLKKSLNN